MFSTLSAQVYHFVIQRIVMHYDVLVCITIVFWRIGLYYDVLVCIAIVLWRIGLYYDIVDYMVLNCVALYNMNTVIFTPNPSARTHLMSFKWDLHLCLKDTQPEAV